MFWTDLHRRGFFEPFRELDRFHKEVGRLLATNGHHPGASLQATAPDLDFWTGPEGCMLQAAVPGLGPEDLDIDLTGGTLTIRGERAAPELPEGHRHLRRERQHGKFVRTLELPFPVDPDSVDAVVKDGLLTIRMARPAEDRPRKITIKNDG